MVDVIDIGANSKLDVVPKYIRDLGKNIGDDNKNFNSDQIYNYDISTVKDDFHASLG